MQLHRLLLLLAYPIYVLCTVHEVRSLDFFYDTVNTDSYTVVKYHTTWCSHCKNLAPVFYQLSERFANSTATNVTFLDVNCDLFGSTLCQHLPGYPMVEIVKPLVIPDDSAGSGTTSGIPDNRSWFKRIFDRIRRGGFNPAWTMDFTRVVQFNGNRNLDVLTNFVEKVIEQGKKEVLIKDILSDKPCTDILCEKGKKYILSVKNVEAEKKKLQNILTSNADEQLEEIRFRLELLDSIEDDRHDEL